MKSKITMMVPVIALVCQICLSQVKHQDTFGEVKQKYLNRKVVIVEQHATEYLMSWHLVSWPDMKPIKTEKFMGDYLTADYAGKIATVASITLERNPIFLKPRSSALGETLDDDSIVDPYVNFFLRFEDGTTAKGSSNASTAYLSLKILPDDSHFQSDIEANLESVKGKSLYAVNDSHLYSIDTPIEDMATESFKNLAVEKFPFLTALEIITGKYIQNYDVVILKLKMPDGSFALSCVSGDSIQSSKATSFIAKVSGDLLPAVPAWLTPAEIKAIRGKTFFKGMRRKALTLVAGVPDRVNISSASGTKQLVFGHLYVYVNGADIITNWQSTE